MYLCDHATNYGSSIIKDYAGIIISLFSLFVACRALFLSRKISFKKAIKDDQLILVKELVSAISNNYIFLDSKDSKNENTTTGLTLSLFLFANFKEAYQYLFKMNKMYYQANCFDDFEFNRFIGNPILPRKIYDVLDRFSPRDITNFNSEYIETRNDYVAFLNGKHQPNISNYFASNSSDHRHFETFFNLVIILLKTINIWLKEHGAEELMFKGDLKIRHDH
ncbi:MAG: hypothetical protein NTX03_02300 [Bacteroidetes bacterium]|nr:hypothetical protein [Bacteroidota bacterium]